MKIRHKLISSFIIVSLFIGIVGFFAYYGIQNIYSQFDIAVKKTIPKFTVINQIESLTSQMQTEALSIIILLHDLDNNQLNAELIEFQKLWETVHNKLKELSKFNQFSIHNESCNINQNNKENIESIIINQVSKIHQNCLALIEAYKSNEKITHLLKVKEELEDSEQIFKKTLHQITNDECLDMDKKNEHLISTIQLFLKKIIILSIAVVVLAILIGTLMSYSITRNLLKLQKGAHELGQGQLDTYIYVHSKDEIKDLCHSFNEMAQKLNAAIKNEKELSDKNIKLAEQEKEKALEFAKLNAQLIQHEEELKAYNQQLLESENHQKAINQQLRASEQQLTASNQQLKAKEQELLASQMSLTDKMNDLERFNRLMVGRELEMIKLKKRINELLDELGQPREFPG